MKSTGINPTLPIPMPSLSLLFNPSFTVLVFLIRADLFPGFTVVADVSLVTTSVPQKKFNRGPNGGFRRGTSI